MKKVMSVFVLLMFVGSLIVMTGCFGGDDDGIGAIVGAAIFVLAISASGGSGVAAFAANTREDLRPAISNISYAAAKPTMKVFPLDDAGNKVGTGYDIATDKINGTTIPGSFTAELQIQDTYTQYLIEVYAYGKLLTQSIQSVPNAMKTGVTAKIANTVDTTSTAKVKMYNLWNTASNRRTYNDFSYNLGKAAGVDVTAVAGAINTALLAWTTTDQSAAPDYATAGVDNQAKTETAKVTGTTSVFNISGFIKQIDGAGSSASWVQLYQGSTLIGSADASSGYYTINGVPNGDYNLTVGGHHTFTPTNYAITVKDADVTGKDFQAVAATNIR